MSLTETGVPYFLVLVTVCEVGMGGKSYGLILLGLIYDVHIYDASYKGIHHMGGSEVNRVDFIK